MSSFLSVIYQFTISSGVFISIVLLLSVMIKASFKQHFLFLVILILQFYLLNVFFKLPYTGILEAITYFLILPLIMKLIYKTTRIYCFFSFILAYFNASIIQFFMIFLFQYIYKQIYINLYLLRVLIIITSIVLCFICKLKKFILFKNIIYPFDIKNKFKLIFGIIIVLLILSLEAIFGFFPELLYELNTIISVFILISGMTLFVHWYELRVQKAQTEATLSKKTLSDFELIASNVLSQKHELKNHMQAILLSVETESDIETIRQETRKYIEYTTNNFTNENHRFTRTGKKLVDSMIFFKMLQAQKYGIDLSVKVDDILVNDSINDHDINEIIGCLLDNAFEATPHGKIILEIAQNKESEKLNIIVKNEHSRISADLISQIFDKGFSTKNGDGQLRGYGLYQLKKIVSVKNWKISAYNEENQEENYFVVNVTL